MRRFVPVTIAILFASFLVGSGVQAESAVLQVSAANNAHLTIVMSDATADLGTNLDPDGTDSNSVDLVYDYQGATGDQGTYYVWNPGDIGNKIEVRSNRVWNGSVMATENSGPGASQTMTISSGVLRYIEGNAPSSYDSCEAGTVLTPFPATWKTGVSAGRNIFVHFYCLRVDWDDAPGTFSSSINYTATQS